MFGSYSVLTIAEIYIRNYIIQTLFSLKFKKTVFFYLLTKPGAKAKVNNVHTRTAIFVELCYNLINALSM